MNNKVDAVPPANGNPDANDVAAASLKDVSGTKAGDLAAPGRNEVSVAAPAADFEPTKSRLRLEVWRRILEKNCSLGDVMYCVPAFMDSDKAAALLTETDEFKKAQTIEVHLDEVLQIVKLKALLASKTLYLPGMRDSSAVLLRVDVPEIDSDGATGRNMRLHEIAFDNNVKLDMVVIGSVVVSRDGQRIGRGKGFVDLDIGLLVELGCITADTIIATMVHDEQLVDRLPANLFQKYDASVDLIVTPTEVIRVTPRLPHPSGIFWELLSARRLRLMPVLQTLKEHVEQIAYDNGGHANITLKEPDTDNEEMLLEKKSPDGEARRRRFRRHPPAAAGRAAAANQQSVSDEAKKKAQKKRFWRFFNRNRQSAKSQTQKSGNEAKKSVEQNKLSSGDCKSKPPLKRSKATRVVESLFDLWKASTSAQGAKIEKLDAKLKLKSKTNYTRGENSRESSRDKSYSRSCSRSRKPVLHVALPSQSGGKDVDELNAAVNCAAPIQDSASSSAQAAKIEKLNATLKLKMSQMNYIRIEKSRESSRDASYSRSCSRSSRQPRMNAQMRALEMSLQSDSETESESESETESELEPKRAPVADRGHSPGQGMRSQEPENTRGRSRYKAQAVEPTKRSLRVQTWKKIQENKCGVGFNAIFNRIPGFVDSDKAATLLSETDEFKKAQNIKVNIDRALHAVKLQCLLAGKTLYLPGTRDSTALYLRVDVPADATEEQKKEILHVQDVHQHRSEISLDNKVKLDMVVIGSVVVSRDGYRIGRGNGFADLDIGLLNELGCITADTIIATMVHDVQVVDTLPTNLFQKYDTPVDLIVTPTEVIRVGTRLPRPANIFWELLSERRLKIIPVLQTLKEIEEKSGKVIVLKEDDTDIDQNQKDRSRRRGPVSRRRFGRRGQGRTTSQTDTEQQTVDQTQQPKTRNARRNRRIPNRRRRPTKSEGDQSGVETAKSQERKPLAGGGGRKGRKNRPSRDFCIKLSNLTRDIRVKDLKSELRKRECTPLYISWKGQFGKCYLHFGNRNGTPSTEADIQNVLTSLNDLSLTITTGGVQSVSNPSGAEGDATTTTTELPPMTLPLTTKTVAVSVELIKFDEKKGGAGGEKGGEKGGAAGETTNGAGDASAGGDAGGAAAARIESVDTTTV